MLARSYLPPIRTATGHCHIFIVFKHGLHNDLLSFRKILQTLLNHIRVPAAIVASDTAALDAFVEFAKCDLPTLLFVSKEA